MGAIEQVIVKSVKSNLYVYAISKSKMNRKIYIVDIQNGAKYFINESELRNNSGKYNLSNLKVLGGSLSGCNYSIARFSDNIEHGRVYVVRRLLKGSNIVGYQYISSNGKLITCTEDECNLIFSKQGIVNASVDNKGDYHIIHGTYDNVKVDSKISRHKYEPEDYISLFSKYQKTFGFSKDKSQVMSYRNVFGIGKEDMNNSQSNVDSFITSHKLLCQLLSSNINYEVIYFNRIYNHIVLYGDLETGVHVKVDKDSGLAGAYIEVQIFGNKVGFLCHKDDKKLLSILTNEKFKAFDIRSLYNILTYKYYIDNPLIDGTYTILEQTKDFNKYELGFLTEMVKTGKKVDLQILNGYYTTINDGYSIKLPFRNNIKAGGIESKVLNSKYNK